MNSIIPVVLAVAILAIPTTTSAQKGTGDPGVASGLVATERTTIEGVIAAIDIGACESSTGRSPEGIHLDIERPGADNVEIHLGPTFGVGEVADGLEVGEAITLDVFRTDAMPANAWAAITLTANGEEHVLRDETLRPTWALPRGSGAGMGQMGNGGRQPCWRRQVDSG